MSAVVNGATVTVATSSSTTPSPVRGAQEDAVKVGTNFAVPQTEASVAKAATDEESQQNEANASAGDSESPEKVKTAVDDIQNFVDTVKKGLQFSVDEEAGRTVIKIVDKGSGEMIRQIPAEEALRLAERISDFRDEFADKTGILLRSDA